MDRLTGVSKILRKNMTGEERHLWYDFLKDLPAGGSLRINEPKSLPLDGEGGPLAVDEVRTSVTHVNMQGEFTVLTHSGHNRMIC